MLIHTFHSERHGVVTKLLQQREVIFLDNVLVSVVFPTALKDDAAPYKQVKCKKNTKNFLIIPRGVTSL